MSYPLLTAVSDPVVTTLGTYIPAVATENQTFSIGATTLYEVDASGNFTTTPLALDGPFVLLADSEQILCSSFSEGVCEVFEDSGTNGRGWNTTTIAEHDAGVAVVSLTYTTVQESTSGVSSVFTRTGAVVAGNADYLAVATGGLTGATAATRFVGGTATVHPSTGTFAVGDYVVTQNGTVLICTVAGTPGTWVNAAGSNASASGTVTGADAFGASPAAGSAATFSKGDHDHGLPANPVTAFLTATDTLTNKRITRRTLAYTANAATPAVDTDNYDFVDMTGQTTAITNMSTNLTGTPVNGDLLQIAITGSATAISWGTSFEASTVSLPTVTVLTNRLDNFFAWNPVTSKWRIYASA